MEVHNHPRWPDKDPEDLSEFQVYLKNHFVYLFADLKNVEDIKQVLLWLKQGSSELFKWGDASSFCTLFTPFHTGTPFMQVALKQYALPDALRNFLDICTELEKETDQFANVERFEDLKNKEKIINNLEKFLKLLPSQESFSDWADAIKKMPA